MSATPPMVDIMARAGYDQARRDFQASQDDAGRGHDLPVWEDAQPAYREAWKRYAIAMLNAQGAWVAPLLAPRTDTDPPPLPDPPRECWLAVLKHPAREGECLYRLEYEANPRVYDKGRGERVRLIERVQLPPSFAGGLLDAVEWWKHRKPQRGTA